MRTAIGLTVSVITVYTAARFSDGKSSRRGRSLFFTVTAVEVLLLILFGRGGILPTLGISYAVLQSLSYYYDVAAGKYPAEKSFCKVAWFILYPPQLLMGPIGRYDALQQTLFSPRVTWRGLTRGLQRMLFGAFKKLVLADRLAPMVAFYRTSSVGLFQGMVSGTEGAGIAFVSSVFLVMLFYAIRLYADFTGGIDLVLGFSELFGIRLAENFELPYFATSLKDFWRRWHITMASWFREYVFYPLGTSAVLRRLKHEATEHLGKAGGRRIPLYLTTLLVWLLTGLWHGFTMSCVLWGLSNGVLLLLSYELAPLAKRFCENHPFTKGKAYEWFRIMRTWCVVGALRLFDVYGAVDVVPQKTPPDLADILVVLCGTAVLFALGLWKRHLSETLGKGASLRTAIGELPALCRAALWFLLFASVLVLGVYGTDYIPSRFIYQR